LEFIGHESVFTAGLLMLLPFGVLWLLTHFFWPPQKASATSAAPSS